MRAPVPFIAAAGTAIIKGGNMDAKTKQLLEEIEGDITEAENAPMVFTASNSFVRPKETLHYGFIIRQLLAAVLQLDEEMRELRRA